MVKELYPDIPHQRCLVHTQRRCEGLLTKNPQTEAGIRLLSIVKELNQVKTIGESKIWIAWFQRWETEYEYLINKDHTEKHPRVRIRGGTHIRT